MKPAAIVRERGELSLSGASLTALMSSVLAKGKAFRFRAKGSSMSPFVKDGDVITVSPLSAGELRTGEVVAFLHPKTGHVAVHRIVRAAPDSFLLRGDNSQDADGALTRERILGIVTDVVRDGRRIEPGSARWRPAIAFLSRTGGLAHALGLLRRLAGRRGKGTP